VGEVNKLETTIQHEEIEELDDLFLKSSKNSHDLIVICAARFGLFHLHLN